MVYYHWNLLIEPGRRIIQVSTSIALGHQLRSLVVIKRVTLLWPALSKERARGSRAVDAPAVHSTDRSSTSSRLSRLSRLGRKLIVALQIIHIDAPKVCAYPRTHFNAVR